MTVEAADDMAIAKQSNVNSEAQTSATTILLLRVAFRDRVFPAVGIFLGLAPRTILHQPAHQDLCAAQRMDHGRDAFIHLSYMLQETVLGFTFGSMAGISLGLLLGLVPFPSRLLDPIIVAFYSIPKFALAPLFIVWFRHWNDHEGLSSPR